MTVPAAAVPVRVGTVGAISGPATVSTRSDGQGRNGSPFDRGHTGAIAVMDGPARAGTRAVNLNRDRSPSASPATRVRGELGYRRHDGVRRPARLDPGIDGSFDIGGRDRRGELVRSDLYRSMEPVARTGLRTGGRAAQAPAAGRGARAGLDPRRSCGRCDLGSVGGPSGRRGVPARRPSLAGGMGRSGPRPFGARRPGGDHRPGAGPHDLIVIEADGDEGTIL
jgi:hypothetical protein